MRNIRLALLVSTALGIAAPVLGDVGRVGPETPVSTDGSTHHDAADIATNATGDFVIVWTAGTYYSNPGDGSDEGIVGRRFDAAGAPTGAPFLVNTYTTGTQFGASVASDGAGGFVVAWNSGRYSSYQPTQDGSATGVFVQRYDATGARLGSEIQANTYTRGPQRAPDVAVDAAGNFVVAWASGNSYFTQDGDGAGIFAQRFNSTGASIGSEFRVNQATASDQDMPAVAALPSGGFVVVWEDGGYDGGRDGDRLGIFGQRFDATGVREGIEFQVNSLVTGHQYGADVAARPDGGFVVVWQNDAYFAEEIDGAGASVSARVFGPDGAPLSAQFLVNAYTTGNQDSGRVAVDGTGNFVVTWESGSYYGDGPDGSGAAVRARHFAPTGVPIGDEVQVNTYTTGTQSSPAIAPAPQGAFVVAWTDYGGGALFDDAAIYAQRLATTGFAPATPLAGTTLVLQDAANAARRKLRLTAKDSAVNYRGLAGSIDDPTVHGATLRVRGTGFDDTYVLPAARWRAVGPGLGYEYRDGRRIDGPIVRVRIRRAKLLDVRGQGAGLGHTLASNPRPVVVQLQLGTVGQRACVVATDGPYAFQPGRSFTAKNASAPDACPD